MSSLIRVVTDEKYQIKENKDFQLSIPDKFNNSAEYKQFKPKPTGYKQAAKIWQRTLKSLKATITFVLRT